MKELINIQSTLKVAKNKTNVTADFKYRSAEDILEALKPLLADQKCFVTLSDDMVMVGDRIYVKATATLFCEDSTRKVEATAFAREPEKPKAHMDESQVTGSASSYARKYALCGLFAIADEADSDQVEPIEKKKETVRAKAKKTTTKPQLP